MQTIDTAAAESLRSFALEHNEIAFAHLVTAALSEAWAMERVVAARFRMDGSLDRQPTLNDWCLKVIRSTDTTRPDGAIASSTVAP